MRLKRIKLETAVIPEIGEHRTVHLTFGNQEEPLCVALPEEWDGWDRDQRVAWAKQVIADHLATHAYDPVNIFPDDAAKDQAEDDLEQLPGWTTWTPEEAEAWIEENVTDVASAKVAMKQMAKAIVLLTNIVLER